MGFEDFIKLYYDDISPRIRKNTLLSKQNMISSKIMPYFKNKNVSEIKPSDIRKWQNQLISQGYAPTYLRTINNQLTAIFNFAVKYYDLKNNPCSKAGSMGKNQADEMNFWTKEEFSKFIDAVMDKYMSYMGFMILFWTGLRIGELLALTVDDINLVNKTIFVSKSLQRIEGEDIITPPKTPKSIRTVSIPNFLADSLGMYISHIYNAKGKSRLFPVTKHYFEKEITRGCKISGVKKIRLHDLRHSHCALLFEMGISPLEVADRLGHERVKTTLNTYAHLYPNKQKQISDKLNKIYEEGLECQ